MSPRTRSRRVRRPHFEALEIRLAPAAGPALAAPQAFPLQDTTATVVALHRADFTGDSRADLLAVAAASLEVLPGLADGTFGASIATSVTSAPLARAVVADFNRDGVPDVLAATTATDATFNLQLFRGNSDGSFRAPTGVAGGPFPGGLVVADFNADGNPDAAVLNAYFFVDFETIAGVTVLLGRGDGSFQTPVTLHPGTAGDWLGAADVTGDGRVDLLVHNLFPEPSFGVLAGRGDGTFADQVTAPAPALTGPQGPVTALTDLGGDSRPDLVSVDFDTEANPTNGYVLRVLTGQGGAAFTVSQTIPLAGTPFSITAADLTGDGRPDAALGLRQPETDLAVFANNNGSLDAPTQFTVGDAITGPLLATDGNGDGPVDLLTPQQQGLIGLLRGTGGGSFATPVSQTLTDSTLRTAYHVASVDLSPATAPEVAVLVSNGITVRAELVVVRTGINGSLQTLSTTALDVFADRVTPGDFNGDGRTDLFLSFIGKSEADPVSGTVTFTGGGYQLLLGSGDGTFSSSLQGDLNSPIAVQARDFDGDGRLDVALASSNDDVVRVLLGVGDGSFAAPVVYPVNGIDPRDLQVADIDGDGRLDLVVSYLGGSGISGGVAVLRGAGDGTFGAAVNYFNESEILRPSLLAVADFDRDGNPDIYLDDGRVGRNAGDGSFGSLTGDATPPPQGLNVLQAVDLDGDGNLDTLRLAARRLAIQQGVGDGSFRAPTFYTLTDFHFAVTDLGGDSRPDLLAPNVTGLAGFFDDSMTPTTARLTGVRSDAAGVGFAVTLSVPAAGTTTVGYAVETLDSSGNVTGVAVSGTATVATGQSTSAIAIPATALGTARGPAQVRLFAPSEGTTLGLPYRVDVTLAGAQGSARLQFTSATATVSEDGGSVVLTVTRTSDTTGTVTVQFATQDGSAIAGSDYDTTTGTLTFAPGETTRAFAVPIRVDADKGNETFSAVLSSPSSGAALGSPTTVAITITDPASGEGGVIQFAAATFVEAEGKSALLTLARTGNLTATETIVVSIAPGTGPRWASATDVGAASVTVTFAPDQASATAAIPLVDDAFVEGPEAFTASLGSPSGSATLGSQATATVTITDNDGTPTNRFVNESYIRVLNVQVDPGGLVAWSNFLDQNPGAAAREQFIRILLGTEAGRRVQLDRLYQQYIDRPVDEGGRVFWSNLINLGRVNLDQVGGFVISSQEFLDRVGGTATAFADEVVRRATGRARTGADPAVPNNLLDSTPIDVTQDGRIDAADAGFTVGQLARFLYALSVNGGDGTQRTPAADQFSVDTYYALAGVPVDGDRARLVNILQGLQFYPLDDDVVFAMILAKRQEA